MNKLNAGGDVVLLYASKYQDINFVINVSGRYDLKKGIKERLGDEFMERIEKEGYIDVKNKKGIYIAIIFKFSGLSYSPVIFSAVKLMSQKL